MVREELLRFQDEHVEVEHVSLREKLLVALVEGNVVVPQLIAPKAVRRKPRQHSAVPSSISLEPAEDRELILLVGDAKPGLESDVRAELAEQLRAEGMNGSALDSLYARAEVLQSRSDLVRGLVGEREDADSIRVDSVILDEESNALDEAKRLPGTGARQNEDRAEGSFNRLALRGRRNAQRNRRDRRSYGGDRVIFGQARDRSRQGLVL